MIRLVPYIATAMVAAYLSWSATDYRLKSEIASINSEHSRLIGTISLAMTAEITKARDRAKELRHELAAIDDKHTKELQSAKQESDDLRDAVDDGAKRLLIQTRASANNNCPGVPGAASSTSVGAGAGAELDQEAERAYYNLRSGIDSAESKLATCPKMLSVVASQLSDDN